jgi:hypothetical protein
MSESGQRQDVAFLALAVAVLAIAVALFVGMRTMPKMPTGEAEPTAEEAGTEESQPEAALEPTGRDPFESRASGAGAARGRDAGPPQLKLVGIVTRAGERPMAVVHSGAKRYYARVGERAAGYTVVSIGGNTAVLEGDGARVTLVLREPEPPE